MSGGIGTASDVVTDTVIERGDVIVDDEAGGASVRLRVYLRPRERADSWRRCGGGAGAWGRGVRWGGEVVRMPLCVVREPWEPRGGGGGVAGG